MNQKIYYSFHDIPRSQNYSYGSYGKPQLKFTKTELRDIFISIGVITIALSIAFSSREYSRILSLLPLSFLAVITAFFCHEVAHKYMGIRYGYWSEYRMYPQGLLFALILSLTGFLFVAPGAVHIFGSPTREENGKISVAGPFINIIIAFIFVGISAIIDIVSDIAILIAYINGVLAFFNLLPIGPLDGRKIMRWNIGIWLVMLLFCISLIPIASYVS